jgi:predicted transposase/invertase (TIGR01784 family)
MFDSTCKFLAEICSQDFATWLLGEPINLTELSPTELSLELIRADALILLQSEELVLQIEFQTDLKRTVPFRMLDYRVRTYRRFPHKRMHQVVIYLQKTSSELVYQTTFNLEKTTHEYQVIRLWEQPTEFFLQSPVLLPFAVLTQTQDKTATLRQVAAEINRIADPKLESNIAASTFVLAGLVLEAEVVQQLLRKEIMQESVTYQAIKAEGHEEGLEREARSFLLRLLNRKLGSVPESILSQIQGLSVEQMEALGEALFDCSTTADLEAWLQQS